MVAEDWANAVSGNLRLGKALPQMNQQLLEELLEEETDIRPERIVTESGWI